MTTKTKHFFLKSSAEKFATDLKHTKLNINWVSIYPSKTWGPRGCFHVPFSGWDVQWME